MTTPSQENFSLAEALLLRAEGLMFASGEASKGSTANNACECADILIVQARRILVPEMHIGTLGDITVTSNSGCANVRVDDRIVLTLDDSNGNLEELANLLVQASSHPVLENYPSKSLDEDFDHFLAYSGFGDEPADVIAKIKTAYADQLAPNVIAKASAAPL